MSGRCLCGDSSCPWCGNPNQAAYEQWCEHIIEVLDELCLDEVECHMVEMLIKSQVSVYRDTLKKHINRIKADEAEYDFFASQKRDS